MLLGPQIDYRADITPGAGYVSCDSAELEIAGQATLIIGATNPDVRNGRGIEHLV
jgi:hypothetical protein